MKKKLLLVGLLIGSILFNKNTALGVTETGCFPVDYTVGIIGERDLGCVSVRFTEGHYCFGESQVITLTNECEFEDVFIDGKYMEYGGQVFLDGEEGGGIVKTSITTGEDEYSLSHRRKYKSDNKIVTGITQNDGRIDWAVMYIIGCILLFLGLIFFIVWEIIKKYVIKKK